MEESYWGAVWHQFRRHRMGMVGLIIVAFFSLIGIYAPFLASSKPFFVIYDGHLYFPLFRYLFYTGFYSKRIDLFFNLLIFTLPLALLALGLTRGWWRRLLLLSIGALQLTLFFYFSLATPRDPEADLNRVALRQERLTEQPNWRFDLESMSPYARLNLLLRYQQRRDLHHRFVLRYQTAYQADAYKRWLSHQVRAKRGEAEGLSLDQLIERVVAESPAEQIAEAIALPTLWSEQQRLWRSEEQRHLAMVERLEGQGEASSQLDRARARLDYLADRRSWLEQESAKLSFQVMPLLRPFHWEDDAGGEQSLNQYVHWYDLTRINRKDLVASLLFGIRISLVVGLTAVAISLFIGIPVGALAGYRGGRTDIWVMRGIEIWESMPTFFMLLMVVAILQTKSIFIVIAVLGIFGWTGFSRYLRGEFLKQRNLSYVEACRAMGYTDWKIVFSHILPNAIPPLLTLLPFSVMVAITSEAGLSFLGLGEEGSTSWGVLMDEGRTAFPAESYLLWPPAIMLTLLLIAIALVGDGVRDALDPKMR